jgi:hypothetical protein
MEARHIDDRIPGEIERIKAIRKSAWEEARVVVYRSCEDCYMDIVVEYDTEHSDVENMVTDEDDSVAEDEVPFPDKSSGTLETNGPAHDENGPAGNGDDIASEVDNSTSYDEGLILGEDQPVFKEGILARRSVISLLSPENLNFPPLSRKRFLCHSCEEETAAKKLQCNLCGDHFKVLPSHDAYTSEKPICGQCVWTNMWLRGDTCCSHCRKLLVFQMRPHSWNEFEDDDVPLCRECRVELMGEDDEESLMASMGCATVD